MDITHHRPSQVLALMTRDKLKSWKGFLTNEWTWTFFVSTIFDRGPIILPNSESADKANSCVVFFWGGGGAQKCEKVDPFGVHCVNYGMHEAQCTQG